MRNRRHNWSWWRKQTEAMMEELMINALHLGFPGYFNSLPPNLS